MGSNIILSTNIGKLRGEEKYMLGDIVVTVLSTGSLSILQAEAWNSIQYEKLSQTKATLL